jgi:hypothetical protein
MKKGQTFFYVDVPLRSAMRVVLKRPKGYKKEDVIASVTSDELSDCELLTGWECVRESWEMFLRSSEEPFEFKECDELPPLSDAEMAGANAIFRYLKDQIEQLGTPEGDRLTQVLQQM